MKLEGWENSVTIVSNDMRYWNAPEKADILVSLLVICVLNNGSIFALGFWEGITSFASYHISGHSPVVCKD